MVGGGGAGGFQFHYGTIKSRKRLFETPALMRFNSIMVQLKGGTFYSV